MIRKSKLGIADIITVFLFSEDNSLIICMVLVMGCINLVKRYKVAYLFKAGDVSIFYL